MPVAPPPAIYVVHHIKPCGIELAFLQMDGSYSLVCAEHPDVVQTVGEPGGFEWGVIVHWAANNISGPYRISMTVWDNSGHNVEYPPGQVKLSGPRPW